MNNKFIITIAYFFVNLHRCSFYAIYYNKVANYEHLFQKYNTIGIIDKRNLCVIASTVDVTAHELDPNS